jgi:hypothetical protein
MKKASPEVAKEALGQETVQLLISQVHWARPTLRPLNVELAGTGDGPVGIKDLLGTEWANGIDSSEFKSRGGRCYELSNYAMLFGDAPDFCRLVHGSIHGPYEGNERIAHAWLLARTPLRQMVWEPYRACWYDMHEWYRWSRAWDEREYAYVQVRNRTQYSGHFGPWHESGYPSKEA